MFTKQGAARAANALWASAAKFSWPWLPMLVLLLAMAPLHAADTDKPLAADEGWLLLIADNAAQAHSLLLDGPGLLGDDLVRGLGAGRNVRLLRAKAGRYRWSGVSAGNVRWNLKRGADREFAIEAGAINYPGNFILKASGRYSGTFFRSNRALQAMMALDTNFPGVRGAHPWRSDVGAPDPFAQFAGDKFTPDKTAALLASAEADAKKTRAGQVDEKFSALFEELYAPARALWPALNPAGDLLAFKERRKDGEVAVVVDLASGESVDVLGVAGTVDQLVWASDRALYVGMAVDMTRILADIKGKSMGVPLAMQDGVELVRLGTGPLDAKKFSRVRIPGFVGVMNGLNNDSRGLLVRADSAGEVHVFAFDENSRNYEVKDFRSERRLDKGLDKISDIFSDAQGQLRAALVGGEGGSLALAVREADGKWQQRPPLPENIQLTPIALSPDGTHLIVLTDAEREQVEMVKLNLDSGTLGETIAAEPGADMVGAYRRTRDGAVIGARYYRNGTLQTRYFAAEDDAQLAGVAKQFPGSNVVVADDSRDGRRLLLLVRSETSVGSFYLFDRDKRTLEKLLDTMDPYKQAKPVASSAFSVKTADGLNVQGFLTLPAGVAKAPLVVMPHGGPIGVSDTLDFDPSVQLLASSGFAVLRVNYRGSGGAGRAFEEAGHGKWGREIEADVDLAVEHALSHFALDRERVALWGASYGGYSTLMGLISQPDKYRCGVAVAAVTDLPLKFSSSDWSRSEKVAATMKKIVGDPDTQMAQLREFSPVYQYQRLKRPLLLIHGTEDMRVSFEHAWRLRNLLAASGNAPAFLPLPGADHSLSRRNDLLAMYAASDGFLRECLAARPAAAAP